MDIFFSLFSKIEVLDSSEKVVLQQYDSFSFRTVFLSNFQFVDGSICISSFFGVY